MAGRLSLAGVVAEQLLQRSVVAPLRAGGAPGPRAPPPSEAASAQAALAFAVSSGADAEGLEFAIAVATRAGVPGENLEEARGRKRELENSAFEARRCRARNEAWEALESAVGAESVDMLAAAITSAEAAGLPEAQLATAHERHDALRAEAQRRQACDVALVGMRSALQRGQDAEFVEPVVRHAVEVGVAPRALMSPMAEVEGGQELVKGAAALVLEAAVREGASARRAAAGGLSFLERAQEWSRAVGVSAELLEKARAQRASASEKVAERALGDEVKANAAQALAAAWQSPDATTCSLDMAIFAARFAGVNKRMLKLAQRRRDEMVQDEERRAAEAGLRAALVAGRDDALEEAIQGAVEVGADAQMLGKALDERLAVHRRQACAEATRTLRLAMAGEDEEALAAAADAAEAAGVSREVVARARRKVSRGAGGAAGDAPA